MLNRDINRSIIEKLMNNSNKISDKSYKETKRHYYQDFSYIAKHGYLVSFKINLLNNTFLITKESDYSIIECFSGTLDSIDAILNK